MSFKVQFTSRFPLDINLSTTIPVEVVIDTLIFKPKPRHGIRIIVLEEPLRDLNLIRYVKKYPHLYDYVFTYQDDILRNNPKAVHFRCAELWVSKDYNCQPRRFAVSTIVGGKTDPRMSGYAIRHELWHKQSLINIRKEFFLSQSYKWDEIDDVTYGIRMLTGSKDRLFDTMFHIAIENCSIKHYYSEKLLDCIETLTVPIYYGCTNIEEYFNPKGIIRVSNFSEIIEACNRLRPETYQSMLPYLQENKEKIRGLKDYHGQLKDKLISILKPYVISEHTLAS